MQKTPYSGNAINKAMAREIVPSREAPARVAYLRGRGHRPPMGATSVVTKVLASPLLGRLGTTLEPQKCEEECAEPC